MATMEQTEPRQTNTPQTLKPYRFPNGDAPGKSTVAGRGGSGATCFYNPVCRIGRTRYGCKKAPLNGHGAGYEQSTAGRYGKRGCCDGEEAMCKAARPGLTRRPAVRSGSTQLGARLQPHCKQIFTPYNISEEDDKWRK
ncbi:MAG: hypothetical protein AB1796_06895 [Bacillota bacterium]